ncbi:MAG: cytidine/deoxycytidylate deaminase family protein [Verrucomicrobiota bacterium]|nr:cytidine/deoxycytidylate deaminase family protein [Verrucomicrobiota bacterium]
MYRPSWDEYFMKIVEVVALRSNCCRRHVAAIIVKNHRIIATGYNGTPKGIKNCFDGGCERCNSEIPSGEGLEQCICCHAEENAIVQSAYHGISVKDSVMYCTYSPCSTCARMIINAGILEVVYKEEYTIHERTMRLFDEAGISIRKFMKENNET